MQIPSIGSGPLPLGATPERASADLVGEHLQSLGEGIGKQPKDADDGKLRDTFQDFVGQTFFAELIKSMRSSQKGAAYFNGGRAEEIFQGQFDQLMTEHLSDASAKSISDPMFELFQMGRVR